MFFFFKQKTAYEMRISDWSSDVCSSDLIGTHGEAARRIVRLIEGAYPFEHPELVAQPRIDLHRDARRLIDLLGLVIEEAGDRGDERGEHDDQPDEADRSEEHTSELQSLMRSSYAVFCLNTKTKNNTTPDTTCHTHYQTNHAPHD